MINYIINDTDMWYKGSIYHGYVEGIFWRNFICTFSTVFGDDVENNKKWTGISYFMRSIEYLSILLNIDMFER